MRPSLPHRINLAIVDDHPIIVRGLRELLMGSNFHILWDAQTREKCIELCAEAEPDILLLDLRIGTDLAPDVYRQLKASGFSAPCIILTGHEDNALIRSCLDLGVQGILLKDTFELDIVRALKRVLAGQLVVDPRLKSFDGDVGQAVMIDQETVRLSRREYEVLRLLARGTTSRQISTELSLTYNTVRSYVQSILMKLEARTRGEAIAIARKSRLI